MNPSIALAALLASAAGSSPILGDASDGARIYRLHCVACHGGQGRGDGFLARELGSAHPTDLRAPSFLFSRTTDDLFAVIARGGQPTGHSFAMPAYGRPLSVLETWDLVALLRQGQLSIDDFFPDALRYAAKRYQLDDDAVHRLSGVLGGSIDAGERLVDMAAAFGSGRPAGAAAIYVHQDPKELDSLKPKEKQGYVVLFEVAARDVAPAPAAAKASRKKGKPAVTETEAPPAGPFDWAWATVPLGIAMDKDGVIRSIAVGGTPPERARAAPVLAAFVGQGGKRNDKRPEYKALKGPKGADALTKLINRLYYRGLEGAIMFDKEEADRNWAD